MSALVITYAALILSDKEQQCFDISKKKKKK